MDLSNLTISEVEKGINKSMSLEAKSSNILTSGAEVLCDIYGFMICYKLKYLDINSYVSNNTFSQKHVDAIVKYCS